MESAPVGGLLLINLILLGLALSHEKKKQNRTESILIALLFFCSGFPALIYQIVWQRALFVIYGVNVQSVAVVVSAFMLGLGLGSLVGGALSARFPRHGIIIFGIFELGVALFGLGSLAIFQWAAKYTAGTSLGYTILFSFLLLIVPTMLMGATLPLLVEQLVRTSHDVGYSVATLYFVNTFGSAVSCYLCAELILHNFGQSGSVTLAACINLLVGATAYLYGRSRQKDSASAPAAEQPSVPSKMALPLGVAMVIAGLAGFIALGFEIVWFRVLALGSSDRAPAFALLLSTYLAGIAAGSYLTEKFTENKNSGTVVSVMGILLLIAGALSVYMAPIVAQLSWKGLPLMYSAPAFFVTAALLGSVLPLLCRLAISADASSGRHVSLIYVSNIAGSTLGSLAIGFILMDHFGLQQISVQLAVMAALTGALVLFFSSGTFRVPSWKLAAVPVALVVVFASSHFYFNLFGRLIFGPRASVVGYLAHVVENRSGVISVTQNGEVLGGGVHDGFFNIDPMDDKNLVIRAYALSLFHPTPPKRMMMIGLASGSWAQILANHPEIESFDIVEINPGYLSLIGEYPIVSSLLRNPKVHIVIDDGRRWLLAHPDAHYDVIVANNSFYWRDHSSNLCSTDFLKLIQSHLNPRGVFFYNATGSPDVMVTGLSVFHYGLRVVNFMAVSDSLIVLDKGHWFQVLQEYKIDGKPVFDPANPKTAVTLAAYNALADTIHDSRSGVGLLESGDVLISRVGPRHIITDDNMGAEWGKEFDPTWR